jgi:hypothetical protein
MVTSQILYEWTDADNPEQIIRTAGSDVEHDDSDSLDSASISKENTAPSPAPSIGASALDAECAVIQLAHTEGGNEVEAGCENNDCVMNFINERQSHKSLTKLNAPYSVPIWRFPDDTIVPPQLYMTQRPQALERSSTVNEHQTEDDRFPRYIMVFRRELQSAVSDLQDELLGEIKVEKRTSLAELRRIITEVLALSIGLH